MRPGAVTDLLLVFIAIASTAFVALQLGRPSGVEIEERQSLLLRAFRVQDVRRIEVEHRLDTGGFVLSKAEPGADARWQLLGPQGEPAADEAVDGLLAALKVAAPVRRVSLDAVDRKGFGLQQPIAVLAIDAGPLSYRLLRGNPVPGSPDRVYVEVGGDGIPDPGVAVLAAVAADEIFRSREAMVSRRLLASPPSQWQAIEFGNEPAVVRMQRSGDDSWTVVGTPSTRVAKDAQRRIELALARLEGTPLLAMDQARRSVGPSPFRLKIEAKQASATWRFALGGVCPKGDGIVLLRMAPSPRAGCVPSSVLAALPRDREDLVDREIFSARFDEIERITITNSASKLQLVRSGDGFSLLTEPQRTVDLQVGNDFLKRLTTATGSLLTERSPTVSTADSGSIELTLAGVHGDIPATETVRLGTPNPDGSRVALREQDGRYLLLNREQALVFSTDPTALLPVELFSFRSEQILRLSVTEGPLQQTIEQTSSGVFRLVRPTGFDTDAAAAQRLFSTIAELKVVRRIPLLEAADQRLAEHLLHINVTFRSNDGESEEKLEVGERTREGYLARTTSVKNLFVLSDEAVEGLQQLCIDTSTLVCGPAQLSQLRFVMSNRSATFVSDDTGFVSSPVPSPTDEEFTEAFSTLAPVGVVHFGPPRAHEGANRPLLRLLRSEREGAPASCRGALSIGTEDAWHNQSVYYAWFEGIDAVFAIPRSRVRALLGNEP